MPFFTVKNFLCVCSSHPGWMPKGWVFWISVSNGDSWTNHSSRSHRLQEHSLRVSRASTPFTEMQNSSLQRHQRKMHEQIYVSFTEHFHYGPQKSSCVRSLCRLTSIRIKIHWLCSCCREFLGQGWMKTDKNERTPYIMKTSQHFNDVSKNHNL